MIVQVYEDIGEPTDRCPYSDPSDFTTFDITTAGATRIKKVLNQALVRIANWRNTDGTALKIRGLFARKYFTVGKARSGTVRSATTTSILVDTDADLTMGLDLSRYVLTVDDGVGEGQKFLVVKTESVTDGDGDHLRFTVAGSFDPLPELGNTVTLKRNFARLLTDAEFNAEEDEDLNLDPYRDVMDVVKIRDVNNGSDLEKTMREDILTANLLSEGTPASYRVIGNEIVFDAIPDERIVLELVYVRNPPEMVMGTDVPELPESLHEAMVFWAVHSFQRNQQSYDKAYATKRELVEMIAQLRTQGHFDNDLDQGGLVIYG